MILIAGERTNLESLLGLAEGDLETQILTALSSSSESFPFDSEKQLRFELDLRAQTVAAAEELNRSGIRFAVFRKTQCNTDFWQRTPEGGFLLKSEVKPSEAILDIFQDGPSYATECATAMVIVYYRALLTAFGSEEFNRIFPRIELMNWHHLDPLLRDVGLLKRYSLYLPGDRRYFANPDVDPLTPQWQGENVIDLNGKLYYGHGIGILDADSIIRALNQSRIEDADETAYLMDGAGRPNYKKLLRASRES